MARIKVGVTAHRRHKHILKLAKGSVVCGLPVSMRLPVLTACPTAVSSAD